uniref:Uncharacterized protein n=1 Tax=Anguilla anguilla TaxID=7936 RepID=A0A0E9SPV3_ANGAN
MSVLRTRTGHVALKIVKTKLLCQAAVQIHSSGRNIFMPYTLSNVHFIKHY